MIKNIKKILAGLSIIFISLTISNNSNETTAAPSERIADYCKKMANLSGVNFENLIQDTSLPTAQGTTASFCIVDKNNNPLVNKNIRLVHTRGTISTLKTDNYGIVNFTGKSETFPIKPKSATIFYQDTSVKCDIVDYVSNKVDYPTDTNTKYIQGCRLQGEIYNPTLNILNVKAIDTGDTQKLGLTSPITITNDQYIALNAWCNGQNNSGAGGTAVKCTLDFNGDSLTISGTQADICSYSYNQTGQLNNLKAAGVQLSETQINFCPVAILNSIIVTSTDTGETQTIPLNNPTPVSQNNINDLLIWCNAGGNDLGVTCTPKIEDGSLLMNATKSDICKYDATDLMEQLSATLPLSTDQISFCESTAVPTVINTVIVEPTDNKALAQKFALPAPLSLTAENLKDLKTWCQVTGNKNGISCDFEVNTDTLVLKANMVDICKFMSTPELIDNFKLRTGLQNIQINFCPNAVLTQINVSTTDTSDN